MFASIGYCGFDADAPFLSFGTAFLMALVGGAIGGGLICPNPLPAGIVGGLIAGPTGLIAVHFYTLDRAEIYTLEIGLVMCVASLPGLSVGKLIQYVMQKQGH
ncbi:MAG: hypothetical protein COA78_06490 [Blastopirellula sp.]|nr:MAG: hypothetical protein COA78_06490 [Blastopirellula sp.]